ncbi:MAG: hypothetical protein F6K62_04705 [Sphaerospermopsis sp. SIO1G2]|nr:hypothetical protein [Sphaerospermopsis sp. SIO1G2]
MNKHLVSLLVSAAAAGSILTNISPAQALVWNLDNVTYGFGGSASGQFDYDAATDTYSNIAINATVGTFNLSFNSSDIVPGTASSTTLFLEQDTLSPGNNRYQGIRLTFQDPLTDTPGITVNLDTDTGQSVFYTSSGPNNTGTGNRLDAANGSSISSVPFDIPGGATIPTVGSLFALGLMRQMKKKMAARNITSNPIN